MTELIENSLNNQRDGRVRVSDVANYIRTPPEIDKTSMSLVTLLIKYATTSANFWLRIVAVLIWLNLFDFGI